MKVELHIEELVLHGFAPAQREPIAAALRQELERLLIERALPAALPKLREVEQLDAGFVRVPVRAASAAVGSSTARALYSTLPW